jgi:hypothetical protein
MVPHDDHAESGNRRLAYVGLSAVLRPLSEKTIITGDGDMA